MKYFIGVLFPTAALLMICFESASVNAINQAAIDQLEAALAGVNAINESLANFNKKAAMSDAAFAYSGTAQQQAKEAVSTVANVLGQVVAELADYAKHLENAENLYKLGASNAGQNW